MGIGRIKPQETEVQAIIQAEYDERHGQEMEDI